MRTGFSLSGLPGEVSIAEPCCKEGIAQSQYHSRSKEFLEAGKKRLAGDDTRQANTGDVKDMRAEAIGWKSHVACEQWAVKHEHLTGTKPVQG